MKLLLACYKSYLRSKAQFSICNCWIFACDCLIRMPPRMTPRPISSTCGNLGVFIVRPFTGQNTYLLTPWSGVLLRKLTGFQLVKKFPAYSQLSQIDPVHTSKSHLLKIHLNIILPFMPGSQVVSFLQVSPPKTCKRPSSPLHALHAPPISFFPILSPEQYWVSIDH